MTMKKNSNRRALGDIGNLIGDLSTKCVISNRAAGAENHVHVVGGKKSITVANLPVTRQSVATLAKNQHLAQVAKPKNGIQKGETQQCGAKKRNPTMGSKREKPNIKPDVQKSMEDYSVCVHPSPNHYSVSGSIVED